MVTTRAAGALRTFLVECFAPAATREGVASAGDRVRAAAAELRQAGREVDYVGSLLVGEDEVVIHVFRADDVGLVREAAALAELAFERVVESVPIGLEWSLPAGRTLRSTSDGS